MLQFTKISSLVVTALSKIYFNADVSWDRFWKRGIVISSQLIGWIFIKLRECEIVLEWAEQRTELKEGQREEEKLTSKMRGWEDFL